MGRIKKTATKQKHLTVLKAIADPDIFRPFFGDDLKTWLPWNACLRCIYGLPIKSGQGNLIYNCTGRESQLMPEEGFRTALLLTGRRSGKSRVASVIASWESLFAGNEKRLSKGERGLVAVVAPTRKQSTIVKGYIRSIFDHPVLKNEIVGETKDGFDLRNGLSIEILTGDWRSIRGISLVAAIVDEICFIGLDEETYIKSDTELIRALKPALMASRGRLIGLSSPHAKRGFAYQQYQRHYGNDLSDVLIWNSPSQTMNPTLPQEEIDKAYAEDPESARSEYGGEFRDDITAFITRELVEACVIPGRDYLLPNRKLKYHAFVDLSGGRSDAAALVIAHREAETVVIDLTCHYKAPFTPEVVVGLMCEELKRYSICSVTGDAYAGEWVAQSFERRGVTYLLSDKNKNELYIDLLPRLTSRQIELPDNERLIKELSSLERRTRSGGRDIIDRPKNGHEDLANAAAGCVHICSAKKPEATVMFLDDYEPDDRRDYAFLNAVRERRVSSTPWGFKNSF